MDSNGTDALGFAPVFLSLIGSTVGYLQADLLGIVPSASAMQQKSQLDIHRARQ